MTRYGLRVLDTKLDGVEVGWGGAPALSNWGLIGVS